MFPNIDQIHPSVRLGIWGPARRGRDGVLIAVSTTKCWPDGNIPGVRKFLSVPEYPASGNVCRGRSVKRAVEKDVLGLTGSPMAMEISLQDMWEVKRCEGVVD